MMKLNLVGSVFDRLTVIESAPNDKHGKPQWVCQCSCGKAVTATTTVLRAGRKKSCGCLRSEKSASHCRGMGTHGHWVGGKATPEHTAWAAMKARCNTPTHKQYKHYGARGISVCPRWNESFEAFFEDMGPRPSAHSSLERIDNNGNYTPENCRWATYKEQNNNTRNNRMLTIQGETKSYQQWCDEFGITRGRLKRAMQYTDDAEAALRDAVWRDLTGTRTHRS